MSFSNAGKGGGINDDNKQGELLLAPLVYIRAKKPKAIMAENVPTLATKYRNVLDFLIKKLKDVGYECQWRILDTKDYGIPQTRKRLYLLAVRRDCLRAGVEEWWPAPFPTCIPLTDIVKPLPANKWKMLPDNEPARSNVLWAYNKCIKSEVNPFETPVVVDAGSSPRFRSFKIKSCMTITKSRGSNPRGYWCSTKGGPLNVVELMKLQGFRPRELQCEGVSLNQVGACLGNAQSLNVVKVLLPHLLFLAKLIDRADFEA